MSHLLLIESWVGGTGRLLPPLIRELGHRYTFVTRSRKHYQGAHTREIHPLLEHADNVLTAETNDVPSLIDLLRRQHAVLHFDGVLTTCDYYVDTAARVAGALGLPPVFSSNIALTRHKHHVREALERAGLPNPGFRTATTWDGVRAAAGEIGYPLVVKPSDLASSAFVRFVKTEAELREAFTALESFPRNFRDQPREPLWLLEEYMTGEEVSVEACTFQEETTIVGITDKSVTGFPYFIEDGHMFPARLEPATVQAVTDLVVGAFRAVGHDHGLTHTEVKITPRGPRLVEINPRAAGNFITELIERVTGVDLLKAQIEMALGRRPDLAPRDTGVRSAAIQFLVPARGGRVAEVRGLDTLARDPNVVRSTLMPLAEVEVAPPIDNACYLGHVVAIDREGPNARDLAERALARVELVFADAATEVVA